MFSKDLRLFEILARQNEKMLLAYVLSLLDDHALAEDIAQETFLVAYRRISTLQKPEAFGAWLRGIARLKTFEALRAKQKVVSSAEFEQVEAAFAEFEAQRAAEDWEDRFRVVEDCFRELPEKMAEVCRLHYLEGNRTQPIAERLGIDLNAVLKRLERARDALRKCVQDKLAKEAI